MRTFILLLFAVAISACKPDPEVIRAEPPPPKPAPPPTSEAPKDYAKVKCGSCRVEFFYTSVVGNFYPNGQYINITGMTRPSVVRFYKKDGVASDYVYYTFYKNGKPYAGGEQDITNGPGMAYY